MDYYRGHYLGRTPATGHGCGSSGRALLMSSLDPQMLTGSLHPGWARAPTPPRTPPPLVFLLHLQPWNSPSQEALFSLARWMCSPFLLPHRALGTPLHSSLLWWPASQAPVSPGAPKSDPYFPRSTECHALFGLHLPTSQLGNCPQMENWRKWFFLFQGSRSCVAHGHCQKTVSLYMHSNYTVIYGGGLVWCQFSSHW